MIDLNQLIDLAPPVGLWCALNFILMGAKRIPGVATWMIPFLSFALGGILYPLLSDPGKVSFAVRCPVCAQVVTGILIGGAAVGGHQAFKQIINRIGLSTGDTETITKEPK
jgi:hypothetical protein